MIDFEQDGGLSQEEMSYSLDRAKEGLESSYRNFNTKKLMNKNKNEIARKKVINEVFDTMEAIGLDPSDQEALSSFMKKARESHPEMVKVLEEALNALLKGKEIEEPLVPEGQEQMSVEGIPPEIGGMSSGMPLEVEGGMPGGVLPKRPGGAPGGMPPDMQGMLG